MNTTELCSVIPRVADPLCRVLNDPIAAYILVTLPPSKVSMVSLFLTSHREDMFAIMEALSVDLAGRPFPKAVAMIPAEKIHELACMIVGIYEGAMRA